VQFHSPPSATFSPRHNESSALQLCLSWDSFCLLCTLAMNSLPLWLIFAFQWQPRPLFFCLELIVILLTVGVRRFHTDTPIKTQSPFTELLSDRRWSDFWIRLSGGSPFVGLRILTIESAADTITTNLRNRVEQTRFVNKTVLCCSF
jgi:hypothetical protein